MNCGLVVVGGSLGAGDVLRAILRALPADFPAPVAAVLHRGPDKGVLATVLQADQFLLVADACDKDRLLAGRVYLAPSDYHLLIDDDHLALSTEGPVNRARPSIDVLFETAADAYCERLIGVLLSGASLDGVAGLARIKQLGGLTVVQDPESAEAPRMPAAAVDAGVADRVLPVADIGPFLAAEVFAAPIREAS